MEISFLRSGQGRILGVKTHLHQKFMVTALNQAWVNAQFTHHLHRKNAFEDSLFVGKHTRDIRDPASIFWAYPGE